MANLGGLLGTAGGYKGTGVSGPQNPVDPGQLSAAAAGVNNSFAAQQQLLQALQAQQGLQNQSNVYNQLQGVVAGTGPNPAQTMLNQSTGQNIASQAALQAGQRGAASNVGLIARQAAQQGAATQQQAVGQAATLQAQQSLNALGQAGTVAGNQVANQVGQTNANTQAQLQGQSNLLGANAQMNAVNAGLIGATAQQQAAIGGGALQGGGAALASLAGGGVAGIDGQNNQSVNQIPSQTYDPSQPQSRFGRFLKGLGTDPSSGQQPPQDPLQAGLNALGKGIGTYFHNHPSSSDPDVPPDQQSSGQSGLDSESNPQNQESFAKGGMVPVILSPGEIKLTPKQVQQVRNGADPMKVGERIKGKLAVGGAVNSYANDTVKKKVPAGTVIVPRSDTQSNKPSQNSKRFVDALIAKRKVRR